MNNDLISREEAMDVIKSLQITLGGENIFRPEAKASVLECLCFVPQADAEPVRHGRWIGVEYDGYADGNPVYDLWECSECGKEHEGEEDTLTNYCPNCGAKMDGGVDDVDN